MPPWGGFNGNTGIADAHNLAWKIAARDPSLLDTYEPERRPVAVQCGEQAVLGTDFDARFGIPSPTNGDVLARFVGTGALLTRHRYPGLAPVDALRAQTGTRFPHAWVRRGDGKISTLDLFGRAELRLGAKDLDLVDTDWTTLTELPAGGTIRIRPDGFVAERAA